MPSTDGHHDTFLMESIDVADRGADKKNQLPRANIGITHWCSNIGGKFTDVGLGYVALDT